MTARNCPILTVVSARAWKHYAVAFVGVLIASGILLTGQTWNDWAPGFGPGLTRLLKSTSSPLIGWIYTLVLFMTAQAAWLVWWARSRSLGDFHGNYRIWAWAAATWLFFSFVVATNAHLAWSKTVLHHVHWKTTGAALWCWLLPAAAWGWGIALRLEPELRNDRSGHLLLIGAGTWYLAVAGMLCQIEFWPRVCSPGLSELLLAACQLLGHASLFLSTTLHARYVLFCSAEPPQKPVKRRTASKSAEPAPPVEEARKSLWPSWLTLFGGKGQASLEDPEEGQPAKGRKRATAAKKRTPARKPTRLNKATDESAEGWDEAETQSNEVSETGEESNEAGDESDPSGSGRRYRIDEAQESDSDEADDEGESDEFKGLSKREKRKLQQQMREEERRNRR